MKKTNIFDALEKEDKISDATVIEDTGVSTENVMRLVKDEIDGGKIIRFRSKRSKTIRFIALIAAVLALSVVTAGAFGGFEETFGSLFSGSSPDGIYAGSEVRVESKTTNVDFLGIEGDQYTAAAAMELKNTNDTPYVDTIENTWISSSMDDSPEGIDSRFYGDVVGTISYTCPRGLRAYLEDTDQVTPLTNRSDVMSTFGLYFEDESTIRAYVFTTADHGGINGETMTAHLSDISAYTVVEVVYDYSEHISENIDEDGSVYNLHFYRTIPGLIDTYGLESKDGVRLMVNPETKDIVLAKETKLDVEFDLYVKMNYKNSTANVTADICGEREFVVTPYNVWTKADGTSLPDELVITLSDGTKVTAFVEGLGQEIKHYGFYLDNGDGSRVHPVALDPKEVVSIEEK